MKIVSVGEVLWDVVGTTEHLGGAPFNFAAHVHKLGHESLFVSAVGNDARGQRILDRTRAMGLSTRYITVVEDHPTGTATVMVDSQGQPSFTIERPAAYDFPQLSPSAFDSLLSPRPDWFYFGTLCQTSSTARQLTSKLLEACPSARRFYDVNLRPGHDCPQLVKDLLSQATFVKLNEEEASRIEEMFAAAYDSLENFCRSYASKYDWHGVCVTRGADGCSALIDGEFIESQGYRVRVVDTIGAGDAFAAALVHGLSSNWAGRKTLDFANRVGALIASRPGATPEWSIEEVFGLAR